MSELDPNNFNIGRAIGANVDPKISHAIAYGQMAKHFLGAGAPVVLGGLLGYVIGGQYQLTNQDKQAVLVDILRQREAMQRQAANDVQGSSEAQDSSGGIMSSSDLLNYTYNRYPFTDKWGDFVGQPSINFHAMVYGRPKQGKSILSVQWAKYLSENFGKVLYVASEEGFSVTLQKKVMEFAMDNNNLDFANFRDFEQIKNAVNRGNYKFVFIDSVNFIKITPEDVEDIKAENPNTAFITIQQATKNGNFRGSQEFAHNCDIVIRVEAGMASQQGRFQEPTEMNVFESEEKKATPMSPSLGGDSGQLDLFSTEDFSENAF